MEWITLAGYTVACGAAASSGAAFPPGSWYEALQKPGWTPPNWLFPLAWTALYIAIAYAAWRVSFSAEAAAAAGLGLWAAQIALNAIWTPVFFGLRKLGSAIVVIVLLWTAVAGTMVCFFAADLVAGLLFVPYLIWVSYAGALNFTIWRMNPAEALTA